MRKATVLKKADASGALECSMNWLTYFCSNIPISLFMFHNRNSWQLWLSSYCIPLRRGRGFVSQLLPPHIEEGKFKNICFT